MALTGELGAAFGHHGWLDRAENRVSRLASQAGDHAGQLSRAADSHLANWRRRTG